VHAVCYQRIVYIHYIRASRKVTATYPHNACRENTPLGLLIPDPLKLQCIVPSHSERFVAFGVMASQVCQARGGLAVVFRIIWRNVSALFGVTITEAVIPGFGGHC
jgi:hypothetical protein